MLPEALTATQDPAVVEASATQVSLGRDEFLRMLVAQLENQDPLNPQEATEFTAQLAQFSSLEQLLTMRQSLEEVVQAQASLEGTIQSLASAGLIGREVLVAGSHFQVGSEGELLSRPAFELEGTASSVTLRILDSQGGLRHTLDLGARGAGRHVVPADVLEAAELTPGVYAFEVRTASGDVSLPATSAFVGQVTGAVPGGADPLIRIGSLSVPYSELLEVRVAEEGA